MMGEPTLDNYVQRKCPDDISKGSYENPRKRPKVMTASMVLAIIGGSLIGLAFVLYIFGSLIALGEGGYTYTDFSYFLMNMGRAFSWAGFGLLGLGIVLALKRR
ncbi:MAG: hypothetical protein R6V01_02165 [Thermoplasmatota archaeon]